MVAKRNWFLRKVWRTIHTHNMLSRGERVVVAVSGGGDSVAMVVALSKLAPSLGIELVVAHLNHQLRASAREDQAFVYELGRKLSLAVDTQELPPELLAGSNVEARARAFRYAYLHEVARRFHCAKVATGHTRDDQAETILLRLLRGATLRGLRGILPVRGDGVIRPLIDCSRWEARQFLLELGVPWREDESNRDTRFLRNHLRAVLMPEITAVQPRFASVAARLATAAREGVEAWETLVRERLQAIQTPRGALELTGLRQLQPYWRKELLRLWLREQTGVVPAADLLRKLSAAVEARPQPFVPLLGRKIRGYVCTREGRLVYVPQDHATGMLLSRQWPAVTLEPGRSYSLPVGWVLEVETCLDPLEKLSKIQRGEMTALVDADALKGPLVVRPARYGDSLAPLGMRGKRKLQDVYGERRVAREQRWGRPVVEDGSAIVWVPGVVRAEHARISPNTRKAWFLRATQLPVKPTP